MLFVRLCLGELRQCRNVFVCEQAHMDGVSFEDLSESSYVNMVADNLTSYMERLNFSSRDWHKLESCARSVKHVLGGGASSIYDEAALEEVGESDDQDDDGHVLGGRDVHPPAYPPRRPRQASWPQDSTSSIASSSSPPKHPKQVAPSMPEHVPVQQFPELPPPPPPHPVPREARLGRRGVKRVLEDSELAAGICPICRVPRVECFRPGDWGCPVCGQHNYPDKSTCSNYKCRAKRGAVVLSAPAPRATPPPVGPAPLGCDSCRKPRSECWKPNDWECPMVQEPQPCPQAGCRSRV